MTRPAFADTVEDEAFLAADAAVPVSLSDLDPVAGPGYVWHCHIISRQTGEIVCPHRPFNSPPTTF